MFQICHANKVDEFSNHKREKKRRSQRVRKLTIAGRAKCSFSQEKFDDNVVDYILDSMAPLRTVEMASFRKIFDC